MVPLGDGKFDTLQLVTRITVLADFVRLGLHEALNLTGLLPDIPSQFLPKSMSYLGNWD